VCYQKNRLKRGRKREERKGVSWPGDVNVQKREREGLELEGEKIITRRLPKKNLKKRGKSGVFEKKTKFGTGGEEYLGQRRIAGRDCLLREDTKWKAKKKKIQPVGGEN